MSDHTTIKTTITVYPQIYAYVTPDYPHNEGWIKIGYTERKDVDSRIREQVRTANIAYHKLWSGPAKFHNSEVWFRDRQLHAYLRKFKEVKQRPESEWFYYDGYPEKAQSHFEEFRRQKISQAAKEQEYQLRAEQTEAVETTLAYTAQNPGSEYLWNAKPRFGKTLAAYDLACKMDANNVLILTNRPAVANSWFDDFETFIAWQTPYRFVSTADSLKERPVLTRSEFLNLLTLPEERDARCLAFISLQDLKGAISFGGSYAKLEWVKKLQWDLLIIDEAHEGVDTFKTDAAFENITRKFTLHLSGTPFKAIAGEKFKKEQIFNWTYSDEQSVKANWPAEKEENNPYAELPCLNLFSYQMSRMITDQVNQGASIDGKNMDFAFDLNEFFATKNNGRFIYEAEVKKWLDTLTVNEKYPFSTRELRAELKHTFWLLDRVAGAKALEKLLREHPVFENYAVILAAGDGKTDEDEILVSQKAFDRVRAAIKEHDKTITLSVGQLTMGVTVPQWTAILMLSNVTSPSLYMQAAFRAQNPWSYDLDGKKQQKLNAYIFDFAPERTLIIYDDFANNLYSETAEGGGTTEDRENNLRRLLNFFPVIAEDQAGKMVALDVKQVLTIPKVIKAQEVVKRGFMSNLLFQNISGIFASSEAREILEQLNPVAPGKVTPAKTSAPIDDLDVVLDQTGNPVVAAEIVIAATDAKFGEKVYADYDTALLEAIEKPDAKLTGKLANAFTNSILDQVKTIAQENDLTVSFAQQVVREKANLIAREVEIINKQTEIKANEAKLEYDRQIAAAESDQTAIVAAKARYEDRQKLITAEQQQALISKIPAKVRELTQASTKAILLKAEEKKQHRVEDDVRARLRGFARTIPSFLMAYGEPSTTLANFDQNINDDVFQEVTGITLDQFRTLRDKYKFFDQAVFDESVQEFLRKKTELANYFDDTQDEDIFDYIPPQQTNQIFTPKNVVKLMLDKLEAENPDLFNDKDRTFADLYVKSGLYLTEIVKRLYAGLETVIPNEKERLKHILENQIYGFAPSEIIHAIAKNFIFSNFTTINHSNLVCRDLTATAKSGGDLNMKFDVVVGNPPYQEETKDTSDTPVYPLFYDLAEQISDKYCLISPARFLFNAGKTKKQWNKKMLEDKHLKVIYYEQNSANVFPNTDIKGGVAILYRDAKETFGNIGTYSIFDELNSILKKVENRTDFTNIIPIIYTQGKLNLTAVYEDFPNAKSKIGSQGKEKRLTTSIFNSLDVFSPTQEKGFVTILGLVDNKRIYKYINLKYLETHPNFNKYKVVVPAANGSGAIGEVLSAPFVGEPLVGYTQSFISFGAFNNQIEAENCLKYIKSKFVRTMLGVLKVTQHNTAEKWAYVPLQDFTPQSDIDWTQSIPDIDRQLYKKYNLSQTEIAFIEEKVKPMD